VVMRALQMSCFSAGLGLLVLQHHKFKKSNEKMKHYTDN